jgi:hypothetical protein
MKNVSKSFIAALQKVVENRKPVDDVITEEHIHVEGYGTVHKDAAVREAHASAKLAHGHSEAGNHGGAAYYYKRAAMFHEALQKHVDSKKV